MRNENTLLHKPEGIFEILFVFWSGQSRCSITVGTVAQS